MEDVFSGQPCLMTIWDILQKFVFGILSYHESTASPTQQLGSHFFLEPSIPKQPRPAWVSWDSPRANDGWPMWILCFPNLSAARPNMTVAWILLKIDPTTRRSSPFRMFGGHICIFNWKTGCFIRCFPISLVEWMHLKLQIFHTS